MAKRTVILTCESCGEYFGTLDDFEGPDPEHCFCASCAIASNQTVGRG